ncbi:MAG: translesion DNA synthesis-associated protein ImuA [Gammaproteobacteria bacterium]|nr:translesion DNA synthesis-associated protein ImuA [Gammaproteobacteria bacterium]
MRGEAVARLLEDPRLFRGDACAAIRAESTGHADFDRLLPGGGWPAGALTEILHAPAGIGELSLVLPYLARVTQAGGRVGLVGPPYIPYAPALAAAGVVLPRVTVVRPDTADGTLWAAEQMLRSQCYGTVLAWPQRTDERELRRLQLAAEDGAAIGILFRDARHAAQASPAALRLHLARTAAGLDVEILKCRGGISGRRWCAAA